MCAISSSNFYFFCCCCCSYVRCFISDYILVCRPLMSLKRCLSMLAGFENINILYGTSQKLQPQGMTVSLHIVRKLSQCDHCVSCSDGALCGSCCYFEETPVRLTTGCQILLSVILFPLFGLYDCSPAGGTFITMNLFRCVDECWTAFNLSVIVQPSMNCVYIS